MLQSPLPSSTTSKVDTITVQTFNTLATNLKVNECQWIVKNNPDGSSDKLGFFIRGPASVQNPTGVVFYQVSGKDQKYTTGRDFMYSDKRKLDDKKVMVRIFRKSDNLFITRSFVGLYESPAKIQQILDNYCAYYKWPSLSPWDVNVWLEDGMSDKELGIQKKESDLKTQTNATTTTAMATEKTTATSAATTTTNATTANTARTTAKTTATKETLSVRNEIGSRNISNNLPQWLYLAAVGVLAVAIGARFFFDTGKRK